MPGGVLYGTSFAELRARAFSWIDEHTGETPESGLLLEENRHQRDALAASWRADYNPLRLSVSNIASFGQTAHDRLFGPYPDIGTQERRRLLEQSLEAADTPDEIETPRQHVDAISELFRDLEADGLQSNSGLHSRLAKTDCSRTQAELLTAVYEKYRELIDEVAHPDAIPLSEKIAAVADTDGSLQDAFPHLEAVVVSGLYDPSTVETALLERLANAFPVLVVVPTTTPQDPTAGVGVGIEGIIQTVRELDFSTERLPSKGEEDLKLVPAAQRLYGSVEQLDSTPENLTWHEAPTPDREITHLARRLRERLASEAVEPDDILVLAPGLLSYRDGITDTFDSYGIDHSYQATILLERTYAGRAMLDVLNLCSQPNTTQISELATNPLVSIPEVDPAEIADLHRRFYTTAIEPFVDKLETSGDGVETLLDHAESVQSATPAELRPAIDTLIEHIGLDAAVEALDTNVGYDAAYERKAFNQIEGILDSVERVCETLEPSDPLSDAISALEGVRVSPKAQRSDDRVEIIGLQDTPMADFEELYVLGATAEHLSGRQTRPRFFQKLGEELELFEPNEQREVTRYRFGVLLANADRVHITTPETTLDDESLLVSPLVDELSRVTGLEPTHGVEDERRGSREDLQRAMAGTDPERLEPALTAAEENGHVNGEFVTTTARGATCASHRAEDTLSKHDGQLMPAAMANLNEKLDDRPFSHSRMSSYAKCGFKYMLTEGWGFDEDDDIEPGVSPLVVGSIIHNTVEAFYKTIQDRVGDDEPVDLTAFDRVELEEELLKAGMTAVEDADERFADAFGEAALYRLFSGLATPGTNDYYAPDDPANPPDGTFSLFLEQERERAIDGHRPTAFEEEFGADAGLSLADGRHLPVHGVIDRIDETAEGGVTIFDYKSSSVNNTRGRENNVRDGLDFQLPTYALGTPSLFSERPDLSPTDVAARYYILNDDPNVKLRRSLADRFDFEYETFLTETVPKRVDDLAGAISAGAFQPAVVGAGAANCEYCAFRDVCDVRHHRRYDVIEAIDETEADAYVPDGARPGDIESRLPGGETDE